MIMTRSSTHSNEQSLSLDHIGRETRGGSGRGPVTNTECTPALSCAATRSSTVILTLLFVSVQPSSLSLLFPPLSPHLSFLFPQSQLPSLAMGPTPQCYWCRWWAVWSSSSSSSALSSSAEGELHPCCPVCFLSRPLFSQMMGCLA